MKMIVAVIRPEKVDAVLDVLEAQNIPWVTITDVRGRGEQRGICLQSRAGKMQIHTLPKTKLEIVIADTEVDTTIETIRKHALTGKKGDGKIFILPVEAAAWVRTDDFITG